MGTEMKHKDVLLQGANKISYFKEYYSPPGSPDISLISDETLFSVILYMWPAKNIKNWQTFLADHSNFYVCFYHKNFEFLISS